MKKLSYMLLKKNKNNKGHIIGMLLIVVLGSILVLSCRHKRSYNEVVKEEMKKNVRKDSIIYGIHLGMTYEDFYYYCWARNADGLFKPNTSGNAVTCEFKNKFSYPTVFEFFPSSDINNKLMPISKFKAIIRYKAYSHYNKDMSMENLLMETIDFFEKGYGGNKFFTIPNDEDIWVKYKYIKIDGNRKILLQPTYSEQELNILFEDLKPIDKNEI